MIALRTLNAADKRGSLAAPVGARVKKEINLEVEHSS